MVPRLTLSWVFEIFEMLDSNSSSFGLLQLIGISSSILGSTFYLLKVLRWHYLTYKILNEFTYIDFLSNSEIVNHKLTDLQEYSIIGREKEMKNMNDLLVSTNSQRICYWGSDKLCMESIIMKSLTNTSSRVIYLNFHKSVWIESINGMLNRIETSSNPLQNSLKYLSSLMNGNNTEDSNTEMTQQEVNSLIIKFRILLTEKFEYVKRLSNNDSSRPLILHVVGLDRFAVMEKQFGQFGKQFVLEYLEHFVNISKQIHNVHLVLIANESFWLNYWLVSPLCRNFGISINIASLQPNIIKNAWKTPTALSNRINTQVISYLIDNWGTRTEDINRIINQLSLNCSINIEKLQQQDIQNFIMFWINRLTDSLCLNSSEVVNHTEVISSQQEFKILKLLLNSKNGKLFLFDIIKINPSNISIVFQMIRNGHLILELDESTNENSIVNESINYFTFYVTTRKPLDLIAINQLCLLYKEYI